MNLYSIAASISVVFIISLTVIYFVLSSTPNYEKLFASNFIPYQDVINTSDVRGSSDAISDINKAYQFYDSKQYIESSKTFYKEMKKGNKEESTLFYYSISLLALNKYYEASKQLKELTIDNDGLFYEQAKWYLCLSYIGQKDVINANNILQEIIKEQTYNFSKAQKILEKIKYFLNFIF